MLLLLPAHLLFCLQTRQAEIPDSMGHTVVGFSLAEELDEHMQRNTLYLLILDLILPSEDGYSISRRLRPAHPGMVIVMLTARSAIADRLSEFEPHPNPDFDICYAASAADWAGSSE